MKLAIAPLSTNARSSTLPLNVYKLNGITTELNLLMYIFCRRKTLTKAASFGPFKNPVRDAEDIPGVGPDLAFSGIGFFLPHHRLMCPGCLHLKQALFAIRSAFLASDNCVNPPHPWYGG